MQNGINIIASEVYHFSDHSKYSGTAIIILDFKVTVNTITHVKHSLHEVSMA